MLRPIDAYTLNNALVSWYNDTEGETEKSILRRVMQMVVHAPTLTPPNEPLTLNELREMDGEPVWVDDEKTWAILQVWDDQNIDAVFPIQRGCFRAESVLGMKIYRRPPEGEEYT
jgi:hypothetical protein